MLNASSFNKNFAFSIFTLVMMVAGVFLASPKTSAHSHTLTYEQCRAQGRRTTICHATSSETNPYNSITIACEALYGNGNAGHFEENGTPKAGHEEDLFADDNGLCPGESLPTPTPSATPSASPTVSPSPTPEQTSEPTPTPNPGRQTALGSDRVSQCEAVNFDVAMDVKNEGNPVQGVIVRFTYNGTTLEATTNSNGRAMVNFQRNGNGTLTAQADGYPSQSLFITLPLPCEPFILDPDRRRTTSQVLGASTTNSGQVLGASTLANTGSMDMNVLFMGAGTVLTLIGAAGIRKSR